MITAAVLGAICGPFISAALYGLRQAGRALHNHHSRSSR